MRFGGWNSIRRWGARSAKPGPAVIVSNDAANRHLSRVVVVPLTSNTSRQYPGEAFVTMAGKKGKALADQIMAADKSRLKESAWQFVERRHASG